MQAPTLVFALRPMRLLLATVVVALAAGVAQTAVAQPHHGGPGGGGMGLMNPRMLDRMLDGVNASAEQRAQIKQIALAAMADLRGQREAGRALRDQAAALFAQPNIDARAAEQLRLQMLAQHDQASKRALQAALDASRVLTPEQRKQLADRLAQRRSMAERHRAEQGAIEPRR